MAMLKTGIDGLRVYLTGVEADGDPQADPESSRGRFRSDTEFLPLSFLVSGSGLGNVSIDFVSGAVGPGVSTLQAVGADSLRFAAPGGALGTAVEVLNGQSRIIADADGSRYVRVTRNSTAALAGALSIQTADIYSNAVGMAPVSSAERAAGLTQYRLLALRNESLGAGVKVRDLRAFVPPLTGQVSGVYTSKLGSSGAGVIEPATGDFRNWPASGWALIRESSGAIRELVYYDARTLVALNVVNRALGGTVAAAMVDGDSVVPHSGVAFAFDDPDDPVDGEWQGWDGSEFEAPTVTWLLNATEATAAGYGDVENGEMTGIWLRWDVPAGAVATANPPLHLVRLLCDVLPT
jgi:hypothetical protein